MAYGITSAADRDPPLSGAMGELLYLSSLGSTFILNVDLSANVAVLVEPLGVAMGGVTRAAIRLGDTVAVQGSGVIERLCLVLARLSGALRTIVVGGPAGRLELARALGADVTIDVTEVTDPAERARQVRHQTRRRLGADVVLGCVGRADAVPEGLSCLRDAGGRMAKIGTATDAGPSEINIFQHVVSKNATLAGSLQGRWVEVPAG